MVRNTWIRNMHDQAILAKTVRAHYVLGRGLEINKLWYGGENYKFQVKAYDGLTEIDSIVDDYDQALKQYDEVYTKWQALKGEKV